MAPIGDLMWNWSLECDREMENDPNWHLTDEGQACARIARAENERLKAIMEDQRILRELTPTPGRKDR